MLSSDVGWRMLTLPDFQEFDYGDSNCVYDKVMEFRLLYKGTLPAEGKSDSRAQYKHRIRKCLHKQLAELWRQHPALQRQANTKFKKLEPNPDVIMSDRMSYESDKIIVPAFGSFGDDPTAKTWVEHLADDHLRCGTRFVPMVNKAGGFTCSLDILFLRRDNPGGIIKRGADGGDIDNRIKTLFDGLKMPETVSDLGGIPIDQQEENPFYCLLEDDSLVTGLTVTTDRLLAEIVPGEKQNDVELVIHVTINNPSGLFSGGRLI